VSFPSDHALTIGGIAVGLWLVDRTLAKVAAALAILMAFTPPTSGFTTRRTWWPDWRSRDWSPRSGRSRAAACSRRSWSAWNAWCPAFTSLPAGPRRLPGSAAAGGSGTEAGDLGLQVERARPDRGGLAGLEQPLGHHPADLELQAVGVSGVEALGDGVI